MRSINLLYKDSYPINDKISIAIPTVGDVIDHDDEYYGMVLSITAMPIDFIAQLDDMGIDFTEITEYQLFLLMFAGFRDVECSNLIFKDLNLKNFEIAQDVKNGNTVLIDRINDIKIDRAIYDQIAIVLRKIHGLKKDLRKPGNEEAKKYMLERAHIKAKRNAKRTKESQLESLIVAMVNTEQFKYDYNSVRNMSIYQFNESVRQIIKKVDYDNKMHGIYSGTVSVKDLKQDDLNWLSHK